MALSRGFLNSLRPTGSWFFPRSELDKKFEAQSVVADPDERRLLVWEIDKQLQLDAARPIIMHNRAATCWQAQVKGETLMINSIFNGWRFEDVWLDR